MKTLLKEIRFRNLILSLTFLLGNYAIAQVQQPFSPRFNQTVKGDFTMIANNMLSRSATSNYNGSSGNHNFTDNVYVDIDGNTGIGSTTFNSSNATFDNPEPTLSCLSIRKAYLYWAAADKEPNSNNLNSDNQPNWNYNDVKLMLPGETNYNTYTADEVIFRGRDTHFSNDPYICVKDITSQVTNLSNPYGTYQVANVEAKTGSLTSHPNGNTGTSGGWQIVFVYESPLLPSKNISLFDGYAHVTSSVNDFDINFNGFQTIPIGPVNTKIMIGSLEGDRDLSGDRLQIQNVVGNFVDISAPQRASTNFFNSRITIGNTDFTNRTPASLNTLGFDAAVFDLNNGGIFNTIIGNNQTSATLRLTSNQETYGLYLLGLSVDVWAPDLNPIEMTLNSGMNPANPGDNLGFSFDIMNNGNDNAVNLQVSTILPPQVQFNGADNLPLGVTYTYNATTGELTFFVADGLVNVLSPELNIDFDIIVKDECYFLEDSCDLSFDLQFEATYNGILNPNAQNTLSSATLDNCQVGLQDPTSIIVNQPDAAVWINPANDLDRTINCDDSDGLNAAQLLEPATDKCNFTLNKTSGSFVADPNCPSTGTYTNTWTFTDACGRTSPQYVQVITIADPDGPTFNETLPSDVSVECDDIPDAPTLTAATSCGTVTVDYNEVRTDGTCDNDYTLTRTWTATDACGNETVHTQVITVQDTVAPTFNEALPADTTVECDAVPTAETLTADDNCGTATVTFNETTTAGTCDNDYTLTRTWTATDACGNETVHTQVITVQDTVAPTFNETLPADTTVECDAVPTAEILTADDNCGDATVTFEETTTAGTCDNDYTLTRTWTATDACGNETVHTQVITVQDTVAPTFNETLPADTTVECDAVPTAEILTADDNCGDATVTFEETTTAGTCDNDYTLTRTWTATDACGNETVHTQVITVQDTVAPTFNEALPADTTVECDAVPTAETLTADDNCGDATVTFEETTTAGTCDNDYTLTRTWTATDACGNETVHTQVITVQDTVAPTFNEALPVDTTVECDAVPTAETLTADDNCGTATVTFEETTTVGTCDNDYTLTRTWTGTDACGNETVHTQVITVQDTVAPTFNEALPTNTTVECDAVPTAETLTADDNCGTATVTFNETTTAGTCDNDYTLTRTWTATDACGNETVHTQVITVQDTVAPTFNEALPADTTVECDAVPTAEILTADDNCGDATVTFEETTTAGTCDNDYTLTRTWTGTDACGNETVHTQVITVQDTVAPTFNEALPVDTTVECDAVPTAETLTADDNCGTATVTFNETTTAGTCDNDYTLTRTWTATDACGNETVHTQVITVQDTVAPTFNEALPADTTVECDAVPTAETLTADDNCGTATVTFNETTTAGTCDNDYTLTRTWTATDACGNETVHTQVITVQDTVAPTIDNTNTDNIVIQCGVTPDGTLEAWLANNAGATANDACGTTTWSNDYGSNTNVDCASGAITVTFTATDDCGNASTTTATYSIIDTVDPILTIPADTTVECTDDTSPASTGTATATDDCAAPNVTFSDTEVVNCGNAITITRTWTATDACGNSVSADQTITVQDTVAPTFNETLPADTTVECDAVPTAETLTADDNCGDATVTFEETTTAGTCDNDYTLTRTWTATDACGNETVHTQVITVQDTVAPTFNEALPTDTTVECDAVPTAETLTADDNCGTATVTFNETTTAGTCDNDYTLTRTWTATDACGNETVHTQVITVQDTVAPTFNETLPADTTVECDAVPTAETLTADDNCGTATVTFNETTTAGTCDNDYTLTRTWTATDACGNETVHTQVITVQDTVAPTFNETLPADTTVECDAVPTAETLTADDNCGTATVTFNETTTAGTCDNDYTLTRTWTATDACGNETVHTQVITVQDTVAPTFNETLPADTTVECDAVPTAEILTADDNCGDATVTFEETTTAGTCDNDYTLTRTWTATDACGNETVHTQVITVQDTVAPTFNEALPTDTTVECDAVPTAETLTANDNCGTATVTFNETTTAGTCDNDYTLTRTWTATDACGNETVHTQVITVQDTVAPTFNEALPADTTVECDAVPTAETLTANDNCGTATVTFNETTTAGTCDNDYTLTRTWTATDACGNETVHTQVITVQDTVAPTFNEALPADTTVECDAVPTAETLTADDNCGTATVTFNETTTAGTCDNDYTLTRTWTATDACGNETVHTQVITVQDTVAPTFNEALPADTTVECDAVPTAETLTADDNCGTATVTFEEEITNGACMGDYIIERTWTAIDACGNDTIHIQIITVQDTTAPTMVTSMDENITASCDDIPEVPNLVFEDACSNNISVSFNEDSTQANDFEDYSIIRTWTVTDDCGNVAEFTQNITVEISNVIDAFDANRCVLDSEFDLFDLLSGDFSMDGTWSVVSGNATIDGSLFDPSSVDVGMYTFMYSITEGPCPTEVEVNVTIDDDCVVLACGEDDVVISKTVTANGDSYNEFFTISGVEDCGFVIELQIFNRWGAEIYKNNNYQNDWNGDAHGSSVGSSGKVPTGTYYYIINLKNSGLKPFAGPIYVATDK